MPSEETKDDESNDPHDVKIIKINIDDKYLKFICNFLFFKSRFELSLHKDKNKFYATKICLKN